MPIRLKLIAIFGILYFLFSASGLFAKNPPLSKKIDYSKYHYIHGDPLPEKTIFLTFDDGPGEWTADILDILKEENVKATFFLCSRWGEAAYPGKESSFVKHRAVLERMVAEGHRLGSHSTRHQNYDYLTEKQILADLDENQADLDAVLGDKAPRLTLIRPPYGGPWFSGGSQKQKTRMLGILQKRGLPILWTWEGDSTDSKEWVTGEWYKPGEYYIPRTLIFAVKVERIREKILQAADGRGLVVLMHDLHPTSRNALRKLIQDLKERGYVFATMEDYVQGRFNKSSEEIIQEIKKATETKKKR